MRPRLRLLATPLSTFALVLALASGLGAQGLPTARPEDVGLSGTRLERLTAALDAYVERRLLPGGVLLVARDGRVAYQRAFGFRDLEARDPMSPDAMFRIASQTKALVSVAILMLQEEGRLLIGDPLSRYLPSRKCHQRLKGC